MPKKFDLAAAQNIIQKAGLKPLFTEYLGSAQKHRVECVCGEVFEVLFSTIGRRLKENPQYILRCKKCVDSDKRETKYTPDTIFKLFTDKGLTPLFSPTYIEDLQKSLLNGPFRKVPLPYRCVCGKEGAMGLENLLGKLKDREQIFCRTCRNRESVLRKKMRQTIQQDILSFSKRFDVKIENPDQITKRADKVLYYCSCGKLYSVSWGALSLWKTKPECDECQIRNKPRGEEHPSYKATLTDEARQASKYGRSFLAGIWSDILRKVYGFTCGISKVQDRALHCHHVRPWKSHPFDRYNFSNGIVLKQTVHEEFHSRYGKHSETTEDFLSFYLEKTGLPFTFNSVRHQIISDIDAMLTPLNLLDLKQKFFFEGIYFIPLWLSEVVVKTNPIVDLIRRDLGLLPPQEASGLLLRECLLPLKISRFFAENSRSSSLEGDLHLVLENREGDILVSMSLLKRDLGFELKGFCFKSGVFIPGAEKRLFLFFCQKYNPSFVCAKVDRRFLSLDYTQTLYSKLGFKIQGEISPCICEEEKTTSFFRQDQKEKVQQIWDCGHLLLEWSKNNGE